MPCAFLPRATPASSRRCARSLRMSARAATPRLRCAMAALARAEADALRAAYARIRAFHERQVQASWDYREADGTRLGQRVNALERVGLYVPGGKAAYPSSVLMNAIPAKVAG